MAPRLGAKARRGWVRSTTRTYREDCSMSRHSEWTEEQLKVLISAASNGLTVSQMAKLVDRHPETVRSKAKKLGLIVTPAKRPPVETVAAPQKLPAYVRPKSFTAWIMGDPLPGRSALDQKRATV